MTLTPSNCPFINYSLRFCAYIVSTEFLYKPDDGNLPQHIISHYRYENPDALIARDHAVKKVMDIKRKMELGSNDPDFTYDLTGVELNLEFTGIPDGEDHSDLAMRHSILDGEPVTRKELMKTLTIERCLLKRMGFDLMDDDPLIKIIEKVSNYALRRVQKPKS